MAKWVCVATNPVLPASPEHPWYWVNTDVSHLPPETPIRGSDLILTQTWPQLFRDDDDQIPLVATPVKDPPVGQVKLFEPIILPTDDAKHASWIRSELNARRAKMEFALAIEDWLILDAQVSEFGVLAQRLLWQRFRFRFDFPDGLVTPLGTRKVVAEAERLRNKHGRVILQATGAESFRLLGPRQLGRGTTDCVRASLEPVFEALAAKGLWVATDSELEGLVRTLIGMARRRSVGAPNDEFNNRRRSE